MSLRSLIDIERWQEVLESISRNKLRAALTSFAVGWGIFMLVVLLGAGNGLQNGVVNLFRDDAVNSLWIYPGSTTKPHEGHGINRRIQFTNDDYELAKSQLPIDRITARYYPRERLTVAYKSEHAAFDIRSVHPDHVFLENTIIKSGRFINDLDLAEHRKVAVVGTDVVSALFRGDEALGKRIHIGGIPHEIVGVFEDTGSPDEQRMIYLPITTAQLTWGAQRRINQIMFTLPSTDVGHSKRMEEEVRRLFAKRHHFASDDERALHVRNNVENFARISGVIDGIRWFVLLIGLGTIVAGIVGVSNIMLISVKERTREIGLRKAVGATPRSIVTLILSEAVLLTSVAGYVGLVLGIGALEAARRWLPESDYFRNPEVSLRLALSAALLLVFCGTLAGFFPAQRAAKIEPVAALREE